MYIDNFVHNKKLYTVCKPGLEITAVGHFCLILAFGYVEIHETNYY